MAINDQAIEIAELLALSIFPKKAAEDALHVAIATAHAMDFLLTWNCRHIANPIMQARIAAHMESIGLLLPFICTPEERLDVGFAFEAPAERQLVVARADAHAMSGEIKKADPLAGSQPLTERGQRV